MMTSMRARSIFSSIARTLISNPNPPQKPIFNLSSTSISNPRWTKPFTSPATTNSSATQTIEHIVLFKVKDDTEQSKINTMVTRINALISIDQVLHITSGPILRNLSSSPLKFTHLLHGRYKSKDDLTAYIANPSHKSVAEESVYPIIEDIMSVNWVSSLVGDEPAGIANPKPGSAMRLKFLKLKDGFLVGEKEKGEIFGKFGDLKNNVEQISYGENFSPAKAKGFSIASIEVYPGLRELEAVGDSNVEEEVKVKDLVDSAIVLDYVLPPQADLS